MLRKWAPGWRIGPIPRSPAIPVCVGLVGVVIGPVFGHDKWRHLGGSEEGAWEGKRHVRWEIAMGDECERWCYDKTVQKASICGGLCDVGDERGGVVM